MKTKKMKLSFNKTTVVDLGNIRGGKVALDIGLTKVQTGCDLFTDCYNISRCWTVCGGHAC